MRTNLLIEGLPGSGKSTLLTHLAQQYHYRPYREGDLSPVELAWCALLTPQQWEDTLRRYPQLAQPIREKTRAEGPHRILAYTQVPDAGEAFYRELEQHEIYNGRVDFDAFRETVFRRYRAFQGAGCAFECSLLQNSIESLMLFYQLPDGEILDFYEQAFSLLRPKGFGVLYLDSVQVRENLLHIKSERSDEAGNELWFPMMLGFLCGSPYGLAHGCTGLEDAVAHFERRRSLESRILREIIGPDGLILPAKHYDLKEIERWLQ